MIVVAQPKSNHFMEIHNLELPTDEENPLLLEGKERRVISRDLQRVIRPG